MCSSVMISAVVAALVGFGGSLAVVLAAAQAVGAPQDQTASWVAALCVAMAVSTAVLSVYHRKPIITAWSSPGAALIAATSGVSFEAAVGAFVLGAVLVLITATIRSIGTMIERLPAAMLAGVLFQFVVAVADHVTDMPQLVVPMLIVFLVVRLISPMWAVLVVLALGVGLGWDW